MSPNPRIVVIIPVLNEERAIGNVLAEIPDGLVSRVIVVDNGSRDGTAAVAAAGGALVVHETQRGYGAACLKGIATATALDPDIIVFLDGDHSDYPEDMRTLLAPILDEGCDMVIGSRMRGGLEPGAMTIPARIGNYLVPRIIRMLYGVRYTDLGPFRAIRYESLLRLKMRDRTFGWTVEMQIKAAKKRYHIREVPVRYRARIGESKISGTVSGAIRAGFKILSVTFLHVFTAEP